MSLVINLTHPWWIKASYHINAQVFTCRCGQAASNVGSSSSGSNSAPVGLDDGGNVLNMLTANWNEQTTLKNRVYIDTYVFSLLRTNWRSKSLSMNHLFSLLINKRWQHTHKWIIRTRFNPPDRSTLKFLALIIKVCVSVFLRRCDAGNVLENILSCLFRKSICTSIGRGLTSAAGSNKYQRDVIQSWNNCSWQKHRGQRQVNRHSAAKRKAVGQKNGP